MRIVSGKYKGRKILSPDDDKQIRPTSDMAREGVFNVLQCDIEGSRFVDLFAGSGAMGIEALSRGAAEVVFCDTGRQSLRLLPQNLKGIQDKYTIISRDFRDTLLFLKGKWNYIFCDPPYAGKYLQEIAKVVKERALLEDGGYLIYEHDNDDKAVTPDGFALAKSKRYGRARMEFYTLKKPLCAVTGSFDPFTKGHRFVVEKALEDFEKVVVLIAVNADKKQLFTLEERAEIAKASLSDMDNVTVDVCEGMVFEYCNAKGIEYVVRGYRNEADLAYENAMSEFNYKHGGITTLLVRADGEECGISATGVRNALREGKDLTGIVCEGAEDTVKTLYDKKAKEEN